ncbi:uncharacterized protein PHALS_12709 [Plasmopara halstedii]|uniref:Uncharacterized protein n=1 Tax=Plasmopara halstedii TaxID=4781 RepID=A0A0P1AN72_PLAHL|nr:uncharacterized protein PHALS_12709 [Plasmopara halstedii]CEG42431.1 hypothetical protein PHALS_12709 [Plasmopara halstedii]|eukprot:XP_024578800.1 hypothetical protein PHALS_12709 [Plasmopara halstedii]
MYSVRYTEDIHNVTGVLTFYLTHKQTKCRKPWARSACRTPKPHYEFALS